MLISKCANVLIVFRRLPCVGDKLLSLKFFEFSSYAINLNLIFVIYIKINCIFATKINLIRLQLCYPTGESTKEHDKERETYTHQQSKPRMEGASDGKWILRKTENLGRTSETGYG